MDQRCVSLRRFTTPRVNGGGTLRLMHRTHPPVDSVDSNRNRPLVGPIGPFVGRRQSRLQTVCLAWALLRRSVQSEPWRPHVGGVGIPFTRV
jgi:hypothetical protein